MQITLSSGKYNIIDSGQVFLFEENGDLQIDVVADENFVFSIVFKFARDDSGNQKIDKKILGNTIVFSCLNFDDNGTGFSEPVSIATIAGKEMFMMFWSYLDGMKEKGAVRSVKYTLFIEK